MKKILVIYYSQSGQLKRIIDQILKPIEKINGIEITYEKIKPLNDYPFPWGKDFFNCFPESVKGIPCALNPFESDSSKKYDLIILAFQSWFLSPSIPVSSFLQSDESSVLLKNRKVITVQGVRNMWTASQEIVKTKLSDLGADLVGNIVLRDKSNNYISVITIIKWLIYGNKGPYLILPDAGVSEKDISDSQIFGEIIAESIKSEEFNDLQQKLLNAEGVKVIYHLISMELTARKIFNKFADYVLKKGKAGDDSRSAGIRLFKWYLFFVFFVVSPIASIFYIMKGFLLFPVKKQKILYYQGVKLKK
jgi:hypothetical protein